MELDRSGQVTRERSSGGGGEEAGGAGDAGEGAQEAREAGQVWIPALEPQHRCEASGQENTRLLDPDEEAVQEPSSSCLGLRAELKPSMTTMKSGFLSPLRSALSRLSW